MILDALETPRVWGGKAPSVNLVAETAVGFLHIIATCLGEMEMDMAPIKIV